MPNLFTNEEYADIHFMYGYCDGNAEEASREYEIRFPNRRQPNPQVFINTHRRFREFGLKNNHREVDVRNERHKNEILNVFDNDNRLSSRRASKQLRAQNLRISKTKILRTLHKDHRKPYHLQPVQNLRPEDGPRRQNFCNWLIGSTRRDAMFLRKILWTDEATFTRRGVVNYHNLHVWAQENPHAIRPKSFQTEFSLNVWIGIIDDNLCGPYFLPHRLNSALFLDFLENNFLDIFDDVPPIIRHECWFQMDGAPAHYGINVREWCNAHFPGRWIGRLGSINWPPRSPDLTVLDFFIWGYLKDQVYATPVNTIEELRLRIQEACNNLLNNRYMISAAVNSMLRRCQKCVEVNGMHFEQLL